MEAFGTGRRYWGLRQSSACSARAGSPLNPTTIVGMDTRQSYSLAALRGQARCVGGVASNARQEQAPRPQNHLEVGSFRILGELTIGLPGLFDPQDTGRGY